MKILILGSSVVQLEAVEYLATKNVDIHVLSNKNPALLIRFNFRFEKIDIRDVNRVEKYCRENQIDSVYSVGSDFGLQTSCEVSERLGLNHFIPYSIAQKLQNKKWLRNFLNENNISFVDFKIVSLAEDLNSWNIFPCVVKPVDSQGQRGVSFVNNKKEIADAFQKAIIYSINKEVIVEAFIPGNEISVNLFLDKGKIRHFFITNRITAENIKMGIPWKHIIPSSISENQGNEVFEMCKKVVKKASISEGPVYFQMKYNETQVKII
ncbi:MAG TPA: ATP-grasp domain-containing protein, partial [Draconibacterium sp.]|nr:ATP-grasp domain-containing protein [Draconibacterium sp.]